MPKITLLDPAGNHVGDAESPRGGLGGSSVARLRGGRLFFLVSGSGGLTYQSLEEAQIPVFGRVTPRDEDPAK